MRRIGAWSEPVGSTLDFHPDDCWALRPGRTRVVEPDGAEVGCRHVEAETPGGYSCMPLVAQGETVGLLYFAEIVGAEVAVATNIGRVVNETIAASLVKIGGSGHHRRVAICSARLFTPVGGSRCIANIGGRKRAPARRTGTPLSSASGRRSGAGRQAIHFV